MVVQQYSVASSGRRLSVHDQRCQAIEALAQSQEQDGQGQRNKSAEKEPRPHRDLSSVSIDSLTLESSRAAGAARGVVLSTLAIFAAYIFAGGAFFKFAEGWSYWDGCYFCVVTITTVGYGDFYPTHTYAKVVNAAYIFIGIVFVCARMTETLGGIQTTVMLRNKLRIARSAQISAQLVRSSSLYSLATGVSKPAAGGEKDAEVGSAFRYYGRHGLLWGIAFVGLQCLFAIPYTYVPMVEDNVDAVNATKARYLTFGDAIYLGWITASTVGYGATSIAKPAYFRGFVCFHIITSTSFLGSILGQFSALKAARQAKQRHQAIMKLRLSEELINALDRECATASSSWCQHANPYHPCHSRLACLSLCAAATG